MEENLLSDQIIGAAIEVHRSVGPGLLEPTYQACMARELDLRGIAYRREAPLGVTYKGVAIREAYRADFLVDGRLLLELKAISKIEDNHKARLLTYLRWSGIKLGLLINFNERLLREGIRRVVNHL